MGSSTRHASPPPALSSEREHAPDATERAAVQYLARELVPALSKSGRAELAGAIEKAVDAERLERLGRLPERQRREILEEIEHRLARSRRAADPRTIVRLTTVISAAPAPEEWLGHRVASPAR